MLTLLGRSSRVCYLPLNQGKGLIYFSKQVDVFQYADLHDGSAENGIRRGCDKPFRDILRH